ncbi:magnesium-translocating P-type ATPase, partial [Candidatus Gottesmanbacteria bacterium]|nr:magnesium-translocating P-type ATPase [Candidatus Gottesmanbacteria bacterium]
MGDSILSVWWSVPLDQLITTLGSRKEGLTQEEAVVRLKRFGHNELTKRKRLNIVERFLSKLAHPLILLLICAALISAILGQLSDFIIIIAITFVSVLIDGIQEHQAVEGAEKLRKRVSLTATVYRDGIKKEVPLSTVVRGDLVAISAGDIVPADCRLLTANDLCVDQSALTGESFPQVKNFRDLPDPGAPLEEHTNSIFMGTTAVAGEGTAVIVASGSNTELGKVARALVAHRPQTEFEKGIGDFGYLLTKTAVVVAAAVLISHLALGHDMLSSLLFVLALAIGFAPELLPIIITI